MNWMPSRFVLLRMRSTRNGLEEDGERKDSFPDLGMYDPGEETYDCPVSSSTIEFYSLGLPGVTVTSISSTLPKSRS